jgi:hypothetical protein
MMNSHLMDIELLSAPLAPQASFFWLGLALSFVAVLVLVWVLWRLTRSPAWFFWRLTRQLNQGADTQQVAQQLYHYLRLTKTKIETEIDTDTQQQLHQACFSKQGVSRETLNHLIRRLKEQGS